MKTIILVVAHGYPNNSVSRVFVESLKRTGYEGEIGLISNDMEIDFPRVVKIPWDEDPTYFRSSRRLFSYLSFLKKSPVKYDRVITSGIRDVLFQANPQEMPMRRVNIYREPDGPTIGSCPYNSMWIRNAGYEGIEDKGIICAEIMAGTHDGMVELLEIMTREAERNPRKHDLEDQAILNHLYWTGKLPFAKLWHNESSPVYTVGYEPFLRIRKGLVINHSGDVPAVVHQYDRHIALS